VKDAKTTHFASGRQPKLFSTLIEDLAGYLPYGGLFRCLIFSPEIAESTVMMQTRFATHHSPREAIMLGMCPNQQRSATRKFLRLPAWMVFYRVNFKKHVAIVRDMTRQGIFFYSDIRPQVGEEVAFVMKFPKRSHRSLIACKAKLSGLSRPSLELLLA
jgi:hypothetical protein